LITKYLKSLVIGYGSIGKRHIQNLSQLKNMEILVCTKQKKDNFLKKHNCKVYASLDLSLKQSPDFAIICNETFLHISTALKLAKNKIHFFIEKPFGDSLSNTKKLIELTKKNKLISMVGCNFRFHPGIIQIKKIINNEDLGKIILVHSENGSFLPDWHPGENYSKSYASNKKLGGGVILTCIHELDYLIWLFGNVKNIYSFSGKLSDLKIDVEDFSISLITFKNMIVAELHLNFFQKPSSRYCKIIGTEGTLIWDYFENNVKLYDNKKNKWVIKLNQKNYDINSMYVEELSHFVNCIKTNSQTINPVEDALETLSLALSMKKHQNIEKWKK
jgi:predicted dehydrogenase